MEFSKAQSKLLRKYVSLLKKRKRPPTRAQMKAAGYSRDQIRHHFGSLNRLRRIARELHPEAFEGIIDDSMFGPKALKKLKDTIGRHKRFVVTTAVSGCKVGKSQLDTAKGYCKAKDAYLLVLPVADPAHNLDNDVSIILDPKIGEEHVVFDDISLNSNIFLSAIKTTAKQIDPITGLARIGQRQSSFIYGSPKQRLKYVSVSSNRKYPHALMTTGAITKPNYRTNRYLGERTAYMASYDHVMGALVVEVEDSKHFHFRQVQFDKYGGFVDLGTYYDGEVSSRMDASAVIMGDWHSGETDPTAKQAWKELCEKVKPDYLVVHDGFNGLAINPHENKKVITLGRRASQGLLSLQSEMEKFRDDLDELQSWAKKGVVVVYSNHDLFLSRWLEDGSYNKEPHNTKWGLQLAAAMADGNNPLKWGVEKLGLKNPDRVQWLGPGEDFIVSRIQLGVHGHKGANGARGSLQSIEHSYGQSVSGHSHTPEILRGAWQVGTSSFLRLEYNADGASSWMHTSCVVYPNGSRQLINSFSGSWHMKEEDK